jgi:non-heme chloroperoxidase
MPFLKIEGSSSATSLYFEDCGQGKPVVLIHGWPLSHRMWEPQVAPLVEAGYRVISYDRRGFGDSDKPWDGYDYDTLASDLQALLVGLDLNEVTLVGFSMGGGEVARYFGRYGGERVSKAVLAGAVTPYMLKTDDNPDGIEKSVFDGFISELTKDRPGFLEGFGKMFVNWDDANPPFSKAQLDYSQTIATFASPRGTVQCVTAFSATDFRQDLPKITVPTLLIHGDSDQIVPLEVSAQRAAPMIENSHLEVIAGAPHGLNLTHKEEFNRLLLEFLAS